MVLKDDLKLAEVYADLWFAPLGTERKYFPFDPCDLYDRKHL